MKNSILFLLLIMVLSFASCATQKDSSLSASYAAPLYVPIAITGDTITTSGTADTTDFSLGSFYRPMRASVQVTADKISGTVNAVVYLQKRYGSDHGWSTVDTDTLTDVSQNVHFSEGNFTGGAVRLRIISNATAQSYEYAITGHAVERTVQTQ